MAPEFRPAVELRCNPVSAGPNGRARLLGIPKNSASPVSPSHGFMGTASLAVEVTAGEGLATHSPGLETEVRFSDNLPWTRFCSISRGKVARKGAVKVRVVSSKIWHPTLSPPSMTSEGGALMSHLHDWVVFGVDEVPGALPNGRLHIGNCPCGAWVIAGENGPRLIAFVGGPAGLA
jgi:hypothetical protein